LAESCRSVLATDCEEALWQVSLVSRTVKPLGKLHCGGHHRGARPAGGSSSTDTRAAQNCSARSVGDRLAAQLVGVPKSLEALLNNCPKGQFQPSHSRPVCTSFQTSKRRSWNEIWNLECTLSQFSSMKSNQVTVLVSPEAIISVRGESGIGERCQLCTTCPSEQQTFPIGWAIIASTHRKSRTATSGTQSLGERPCRIHRRTIHW
jgi:hypothetical protein